MDITFGKHSGRSVELLMIKYPTYIKWILENQELSGSMVSIKNHILKLIQIFDSKPFTGKNCRGKSCKKQAIKFTVYLESIDDPHWWCSICDPYQTGALEGKLQSPIRYQEALQHVETYCHNRESDYRDIIKIIAQAKGFANSVGESQAQKFFNEIG